MIIDGKKVSKLIREQIKEEIINYEIKPKLIVIQVGNDEASEVYIEAKKRACIEVGMSFEHIKYNVNAHQKDIINKINILNKRDDANGIIVQLPIPKNLDVYKIINTIIPEKDVDGLTDYNIAKIYNNDYNMIPCTPKGIMYLMEYYKIKLEGAKAVVIGKSNLVGKPITHLLLNQGATVTVCHSKTKKLKQYTKKADILVVATGVKHLIKSTMVKKKSCVIDVGISKVDGKIYGDVDWKKIEKKASVTPVPGGVGPMTVAMLLQNTLDAYKNSVK